MDRLLFELQVKILALVSARDYLVYASTSSANYSVFNSSATIKAVQKENNLDFPVENISMYLYFYSKYYLTPDTALFTPRIENLIVRTAIEGKLGEPEIEIIRKYTNCDDYIPQTLLNEVGVLLDREELCQKITVRHSYSESQSLLLDNYTPWSIRVIIMETLFRESSDELAALRNNDVNWFKQNVINHPWECTVYACKENQHDLLYVLLTQCSVNLDRVLSGSSDAQTTAMVLAKGGDCSINCFIEVDNYRSLEVLVKYKKARLWTNEFSMWMANHLLRSVVADAVRCYKVLIEYDVKQYMEMELNINNLTLEYNIDVTPFVDCFIKTYALEYSKGICKFHQIKPTLGTKTIGFIKAFAEEYIFS